MNEESIKQKKPIRILHNLGSLEIGGSQMLVVNLLRHIDRSEIQFDFVIDHNHDMTLLPIIQELGAKIYYLPTFRGYNIIQVITAWNKLFQQHPEYKVLHSHVRSYASIYIPIAKKYGLKTIIHSHSISNGRGVKAAIKNILQLPLRYQADYFMACSMAAGEWLFGNRVTKSQKFILLRNAIDLKLYRFDLQTRVRIRRDLGIMSERV